MAKLYFPENVDWEWYNDETIRNEYRRGDWYYTPREMALLTHINNAVPIEEVRRQCPFELTKEENMFYTRALQQIEESNENQYITHLYNGN